MRKRLTLEEVVAKIPQGITIVPETYSKVSAPAIFIDSVYGQWTTRVCDVLRGCGHPSGKSAKISAKNTVGPDKFIAALPSHITMDPSTYKNAHTKARFIDSEYGEFWSRPSQIKYSAGHPERGKRMSIDKRRRTAQDVAANLPPHITLDESTYVDTKTKCRFIDSKYGEWWATPDSVMHGHGHKLRGMEKTAESSRLTAAEVAAALPPELTLDPDTYVNSTTLARFIDSEYGEWWTRYNTIQQGSRHPRRSMCGYSRGEKELAAFVEKHVAIEENKRFYYDKNRWFEADIHIPSKNLAIEYNGAYWHSDQQKTNNYHLKKREFFESRGFQLLQFYDSEWISKRAIVESIILAKLGKSAQKYQARKLEIRDIDGPAAQEFLQANHLMGKYIPAKYVGLYDGDQLVSLLGYRKLKDGIDISRFCNKLGASVAGGYSKLLKYVEERVHPVFIQSYVDMRYGSTKTLTSIGFTVERTTLGWMWCDGLNMHNRLRCRANMDDRKLSEAEHAAELGWSKVYDSGQAKCIKRVQY
jgi:hypothetical protein